uniref:Amidohydro-rel domain-containing protein n=1 Tax=Rhabditophanes sp. KR3021 TaxID=114890 RepID=A0AC35TR35_9BILA
MYNLLDNISYDKLFSYCKGTFQEMIEAGITSVGEFHYVHHSDILNKNFDLDKAVINAAKATGIRLVLLVTLYTYAGLDRSVELSDKQKHFKSHVDEFLIYVKELKNKVVKEELVTIGIAAHSIRAVHEDDLDKLWQFCANENMPLHMHLEEQPQEIVDCQKFLNKDPSEVLLEKFDKFGKVNLTGVHFSFTKPDLLRKLTNNGTNLCICPTTEGYLGDGIPTLSTNDSIVLGTDCNNRICMIEEARLLAFGQNLKYNNRNNASLDANNLMDILTVNGARSLGLESKIGRFQENYDFDFVSIGVNNVVLSNFANSDELADAIIFSCDNREVVNVCVNGKILFAKKIYSD